MALNAEVLPPGQYGFVHDLRAVLDGTPEAVLTLARAAGLRGILVKYNDGAATTAADGSGQAWQWQFRLLAPACRAAGLACIPWGYVYPWDRAALGAVVAQALEDSGQSFYILDAEVEFDRDPAAAQDAAAMLQAIAAAAPAAQLLLTSWGWPDQHPSFPWATFLAQTSAFLPQIYPALLGADPTAAYNRAFFGGDGGGPGIYQLQPQPAVVPAFDLSAVATLAALAANGGFPAVCWWVLDGAGADQAGQLAATAYARSYPVDWRAEALAGYARAAAVRRAGGW